MKDPIEKVLTKEIFLRASLRVYLHPCLVIKHPLRGSSGGAGAILEKPAPPKRLWLLLYSLKKMALSTKLFSDKSY